MSVDILRHGNPGGHRPPLQPRLVSGLHIEQERKLHRNAGQAG